MQDFSLEGGIIACGNILKLVACSPRKILKFMTSETASGGLLRGKKDCFFDKNYKYYYGS